jgi:glycosyltransferase involved in cell wall biosynthesis
MLMAKRVRVLYIISGFAIEGPLGGIERFVIDLVQALPEEIEPVVCGMWDYGTPADQRWLAHLQQAGILAFTGAPWAEISPFKSFQAALAGTRRALAGQQIDIIHSHCQFGDPLAIALKSSVGANRLIRTLHNEKEWPRRPLRRWFFSGGIALFAFQQEIGVSQTVVERLNRRPLARVLGRRALLCYNSLNLERFDLPARFDPVAYRQMLGVPDHARLIGSVGRLEPQKGYEVLIAAMPAIVAAYPDVHLVVAGDGSQRETLERQAAASPVASHIHLVGSQSPIEPFFNLLQLFVSSSLWEGLPTVILESIAAGVPVVATDVSGSRELIEPGVNGWLTPPHTPHELAHQIMDALSDEAERRSRAEAARSLLPRFDMHNAAQFHYDLYTVVSSSPR